MALQFLLPLIQGGLAIAGGLSSYNAEKKRAQLARSKDIERQTLALKQYVAEQQARTSEMNQQMVQLNNQLLESQEIAESEKGDLALAAEAAKSRALAAQTASGLEAGVGTFGAVLDSIGMTEAREAGKIDATLANRAEQIGTSKLAAESTANVPKPHMSKIAELDTSSLAFGTGLSIASQLAGIASKHMPMGGFTPFSSRASRDAALASKHGIG